MLELKNINKSFGNIEVLKDINLEVKEGEIVALLGKSGSGKSTILNIISGFEEACSGSVTYKDEVLNSTKKFVEPNKRDIGFVFQNYALFPHLNIEENIAFGIKKLSRSEQNKKVQVLLELVNLTGSEKKYPHELSGGQQQRVAIARVLARQSDLILLDEPFSSLDALLKTKLLEEIKDIIKSQNKTAIFVTHDAKEALAVSDKVAYIEEGSILQYDTPKNIYDNPNTKLIASSFGNANFILKDEVEYCIRPQDCKIVDTQTDIKATIVNTIDYGEYFHIFVTFEYQGKDYEFLLIENSNDDKYKISNTINLSIDFSNCKIIN